MENKKTLLAFTIEDEFNSLIFNFVKNFWEYMDATPASKDAYYKWFKNRYKDYKMCMFSECLKKHKKKLWLGFFIIPIVKFVKWYNEYTTFKILAKQEREVLNNLLNDFIDRISKKEISSKVITLPTIEIYENRFYYEKYKYLPLKSTHRYLLDAKNYFYSQGIKIEYKQTQNGNIEITKMDFPDGVFKRGTVNESEFDYYFVTLDELVLVSNCYYLPNVFSSCTFDVKTVVTNYFSINRIIIEDVTKLFVNMNDKTIFDLGIHLLSENYELIIGGGYIPSSFFQHSDVKVVKIDNSVLALRSYCFANCIKLEKLYISKSVVTIGDKALEQCRNLKTIVYDGTSYEWDLIEKEKNWNAGVNCVIVCSDKDINMKNED